MATPIFGRNGQDLELNEAVRAVAQAQELFDDPMQAGREIAPHSRACQISELMLQLSSRAVTTLRFLEGVKESQHADSHVHASLELMREFELKTDDLRCRLCGLVLAELEAAGAHPFKEANHG